jgi:predicted permease
MFVIRTVGASNLPPAVYWFFLPAIVMATKASGNFDAPNEALLSLGMFLETFALVLSAAWLLHRRRGGSRR